MPSPDPSANPGKGPLRLLLYSHYFAPSIGGVESVVLSLASALARAHDERGQQRIDVTLVTQTPATGWNDATLPFRVVRQPSLARLFNLICHADVLHLAGPALPPLVLGLLSPTPVVIEHHGFQTICPNGQLYLQPRDEPCPGHFQAGNHLVCLRCNACSGNVGSFKLWLLTFVRRWLLRRVRANIVPTRWLEGITRLPHAVCVPHGLDDASVPSNHHPRSSPPLFVFQGRLVTTKGVRVFFEAAALMFQQGRDFEILIIGDGPDRKRLESHAAALGIAAKVRFAGGLSSAELLSALAPATAVVVPSLGGEVFGLVGAENMLRGIPVVASDLGAFAEVLGPAGLTFRTGDPIDLAAKLSILLDQPSLCASLGSLGRRRILDGFSLRRMVDGHIALYESMAPGL